MKLQSRRKFSNPHPVLRCIQRQEFDCFYLAKSGQKLWPTLYNKTFLKKHIQKCVANIFTLLLVPFASESINYLRQGESSTNRRFRWKMSPKQQMLRIFKDQVLKRHYTVLRKVDRFGRKTYQKKLKDQKYKILKRFFYKKHLSVHELPAIKNSLITYVCYKPDDIFEWYCIFWEKCDCFRNFSCIRKF